MKNRKASASRFFQPKLLKDFLIHLHPRIIHHVPRDRRARFHARALSGELAAQALFLTAQVDHLSVHELDVFAHRHLLGGETFGGFEYHQRAGREGDFVVANRPLDFGFSVALAAWEKREKSRIRETSMFFIMSYELCRI